MLFAKRGLLLIFILTSIFSLKGDQNNEFLLVQAIKDGNIDEVEKLIKDGTDVNAEINGQTPIIYSIMYGKNDILALLIEFEADVNKPNSVGQTPLIQAVTTNNIPALKTLIAAHADLNKADPDGNTPLIVAASSADYYMSAETLVLAHANLLIKNKEGKDALQVALDRSHDDPNDQTVSLIVIQIDIEYKGTPIAREAWERVFPPTWKQCDAWCTTQVILLATGIPSSVVGLAGFLIYYMKKFRAPVPNAPPAAIVNNDAAELQPLMGNPTIKG